MNITPPDIKDAKKKIQKILETLETNNYAVIGYTKESGEHSKTNMPIAQVAAIHEFGSEEHGIPERSFLRAGLEENKDKIVRFAKKQLEEVLSDENKSNKPDAIENAMENIGAKATSYVKQYMEAGLSPPLASPREGKNAKKEHVAMEKPLIDTGQLKNAITYKVVPIDEVKEMNTIS